MVSALVRFFLLVLSGYHIPALVLVPVPLVLGNYHWQFDLDMMDI